MHPRDERLQRKYLLDDGVNDVAVAIDVDHDYHAVPLCFRLAVMHSDGIGDGVFHPHFRRAQVACEH
jgi:hypothetical protein